MPEDAIITLAKDPEKFPEMVRAWEVVKAEALAAVEESRKAKAEADAAREAAEKATITEREMRNSSEALSAEYERRNAKLQQQREVQEKRGRALDMQFKAIAEVQRAFMEQLVERFRAEFERHLAEFRRASD
jgi:flagellar motility protein MotE (MotC chaperone)